MFVRRFSPLQTAAEAGQPLQPGVAYLQIAYGQTAAVRNLSQRIVWMSPVCLPL